MCSGFISMPPMSILNCNLSVIGFRDVLFFIVDAFSAKMKVFLLSLQMGFHRFNLVIF